MKFIHYIHELGEKDNICNLSLSYTYVTPQNFDSYITTNTCYASKGFCYTIAKVSSKPYFIKGLKLDLNIV